MTEESHPRFVTSGLHHVALTMTDARRTAAFYGDLLGLRVVRDEPGADPYRLLMGAGGAPDTRLAFIETNAPPGTPGLGGVHHVALGVADDDALLRWKRRLTDAGLPVSGPFDRRWFHSIYFRDPDGQILELATRGPGYEVDEPIEALGTREIVPGPENLVGQRDEAAIRGSTWHEPVPEVLPAMALEGIHHVSGITRDVALADDFLRRTLGLRLVKRTVNQDDPSSPHWFWAGYDGARVAPHSSYTLFGWPRGGRWTRAGAGQTHHVAFRAPSAEALGELRERLAQAGVEVTPPVDREDFRSIFFPAPDGMLLEVAADR